MAITAIKSIHNPICHKGCMIGLALMMLILGGCARSMGSLQWNEDVTALFQKHEWVEEYQYYHYSEGWISRRVYAVVGIKAPYVVESRLWRQVEDQEELQSIINDAILASDSAPQGFNIINPDGDHVGIWYSSVFGPSVRFTTDNRIIPMAPPARSRPN